MKYLKFVIFIVLFALEGCKKKPYPETIVANESVFFFEGLVNGAQRRFEAGADNYYMYSSHSRGANDLYSFRADLQRTDCSNCSGLSVMLNDNHVTAPGQGILIDSSLRVEQMPLALENSSSYLVSFTADYNRNAATYYWDFGDGVISTDPAPVHRYEVDGRYNVCLTITSDKGCVSTVCNELEFSAAPFRTQIQAQSMSANTILFSQTTTGTGPFNFYWSFGDGTTSTQPSPLHTYAITGSYPVILRITDGSGKIIVSRFNTLTGGDASSCAANFRIGTVAPGPASGFSETSVLWKDDTGREYSSARVVQPATSSFRITKVEDYEPNENNEPTKKITVEFSCLVSDGVKSLYIENARAVIAVSYH